MISGKYRRASGIVCHDYLQPPRLHAKVTYLPPKYSSVAFIRTCDFRFFQDGHDAFVGSLGMIFFPAKKKMRRVGVKYPAGHNSRPLR